MFLLAGIAKFLFIPLAEAVVFAMLASYLLSRTLVPTLAKFWLKKYDHNARKNPRNGLARFQAAFERGFERMREGYRALLQAALYSGPRFAAIFLGCMAATALLAFPLGPLPGLGQDFFPAVDGGQIKLHMRARTGTRIEETAALCDAVESTIREVIPGPEIANVVDNIGLPYSGINLAYSTSAPVGPGDADIYVNLVDASQTHRGLCACAAFQVGGDVSIRHVCVPAGGYDRANIEFRPALADRCANRRIQRAGKSRLCERAAAEAACRPGRRRSAHSAIRRLSAIQRRRRSRQGAAPWSHRAGGGEQPAGVAIGKLSNGAFLLDRSQERDPISGRDPNSAVPIAESQRSRQHSFGRPRRFV
jgi:hypothetical protein